MPRLGRGISAHRARGLAPHLDGIGLDLQRRLEGAGAYPRADSMGGVGKRECIAQGMQLPASGLYFCR